MLIADGFDESVEHAYDLICSVHRSNDEFSSSLAESFTDLTDFSLYLNALKKRPGSIFLLARQGEETTGFLILEPRLPERSNHAADLRTGVLAPHRDRDTSLSLLEHAFSLAVDEGQLEIIYLMVRADHPDEVRFYEKAGFKQKALLNNDSKIDGEYFDSILMARELKEFETQGQFGGTMQMGNSATLQPKSI